MRKYTIRLRIEAVEQMSKVGIHSEITIKKAAGILHMSQGNAKTVLSKLVQKGYMTLETSEDT